MNRPGRSLSPPQFLAASIFGLIALGALVLALPAASASGESIGLLDAFFTATSAVCVTGLIVRDTSRDFSTFGQVVIMLLIQFGGLGYMTISTVLVAALGRSVTLQERLTLQEGAQRAGLEGLVRFAGTVLKLTLRVRADAAPRFSRFGGGPTLGPTALWYGLFHSVSAFNNAGFALWSDNLIGWRADVTVNFVITTLIICGGLGFFVLSRVDQCARCASCALSMHTKIVLVATSVLLIGGTAGVSRARIEQSADVRRRLAARRAACWPRGFSR